MKTNKFAGPKSGRFAPDQSLYKEVMRLTTEITNMKFRTRVLEAKLFLMESEYDMLTRMLRLPVPVYSDARGMQMARPLDRVRFAWLENLMDPLYNLVQPDGRINASLTVTRYGTEPGTPIGAEPAKPKAGPEIPDNSNVPGVPEPKGPGEPGTQGSWDPGTLPG